ncbi:unnamed protein product [Cuscuta epithymum]|uniref:BED-type domain-containing protein n=1 Tax=Cuscuta epithymum TaxID=186058 RepID=A0AAV0DR04_9ASTE|nr:unnamed protein product [Cuscuta epithymum]CAH9126526.1 unnamed protein product [Cuscuta epithymum]CAH9140758.1 unnamed protein product [Cuscuta epithymum]
MAPKLDIAWEHATPFEGNRKLPQCNYCRKIIDGITQLKRHIAHAPGTAEPCPSAPKAVSHMLMRNLTKGRKKETLSDVFEMEGNRYMQAKLCGDESSHMDVDYSGDEGLTELEKFYLKQAMEESRQTARLEEEQRKKFDSAVFEIMTPSTGNDIAGPSSNSTSKTKRGHSSRSTKKKAQIVELQIEELEKELNLQKQKVSDLEQENLQLKKQMLHMQEELQQPKMPEEKNLGVHELEALLFQKETEINELKEKLAEKDDELHDAEDLNQTLMLKERMSNTELQEARRELINVWPDLMSTAKVVIKRMGEIDQTPFQNVCIRKFGQHDWEVKATKLSSWWQEMVNNPNWHPFKTIEKDGKLQEVINEDDLALKELKYQLGDAPYKAVIAALLDLNEYNPSGRYITPELWNLSAGKKATLQEAVKCMIQQLKKSSRYPC